MFGNSTAIDRDKGVCCDAGTVDAVCVRPIPCQCRFRHESIPEIRSAPVCSATCAVHEPACCRPVVRVQADRRESCPARAGAAMPNARPSVTCTRDTSNGKSSGSRKTIRKRSPRAFCKREWLPDRGRRRSTRCAAADQLFDGFGAFQMKRLQVATRPTSQEFDRRRSPGCSYRHPNPQSANPATDDGSRREGSTTNRRRNAGASIADCSLAPNYRKYS